MSMHTHTCTTTGVPVFHFARKDEILTYAVTGVDIIYDVINDVTNDNSHNNHRYTVVGK